MTIHKDLIQGSTATQTSSGVEIERMYYIPELAGSADEKVNQALLHPQVPNFGDAHPVRSGIFVSSISASARDAGAEVIVKYAPPDINNNEATESGAAGIEITLDSGTTTEQVIEDINGNLMEVGFKGRVGTGLAQITVETVGEIDVDRPQLQATISKNEPNIPLDKATRFTATVNKRKWSGFPAKTWLCKGIRSNPNGSIHRVDYAFVYKPDKWTVQVSAKEEGLIPIDAVDGNGIKEFDVYRLEDFNQLGVRLR